MKTIKHLLFGGLFLSLIACVDDKPLTLRTLPLLRAWSISMTIMS